MDSWLALVGIVVVGVLALFGALTLLLLVLRGIWGVPKATDGSHEKLVAEVAALRRTLAEKRASDAHSLKSVCLTHAEMTGEIAMLRQMLADRCAAETAIHELLAEMRRAGFGDRKQETS